MTIQLPDDASPSWSPEETILGAWCRLVGFDPLSLEVPMARLPDPATRQRWQRLIHLYDDAGCSIADFCDLHEVSTGSFYAWRRRLDAHAPNDGFLKVWQPTWKTCLRACTALARFNENVAGDRSIAIRWLNIAPRVGVRSVSARLSPASQIRLAAVH